MQKIFSISDLKSNKITAADPIIIPDWIFNSIIALCRLEVEYAGNLILFNKIAEYPFISAKGSTGSVFPTKKIIFNNSTNYSTIEFHTHQEALGDFWTKQFSGGDLNTFNNRILQEGESYQHILFTTENILTWGKHEAPDVRIGFKNTDVVMDNFNYWNEKYKCWKPVTPTI